MKDMLEPYGNDILGQKLSKDKRYAYHILIHVEPYLTNSDISQAIKVCPLWREILQATRRGKDVLLEPCQSHFVKLLEKHGSSISAIDISRLSDKRVANPKTLSKLKNLKHLKTDHLGILKIPKPILNELDSLDLENFQDNTLDEIMERVPNLTKICLDIPIQTKTALSFVPLRTAKRLKHLCLNLKCSSISYREDLSAIDQMLVIYHEHAPSASVLINHNPDEKILDKLEMADMSMLLKLNIQASSIKTLESPNSLSLPDIKSLEFLINVDRSFFDITNETDSRQIAWQFYSRAGMLLMANLEYHLNARLWLHELQQLTLYTNYPKIGSFDQKQNCKAIGLNNITTLRVLIYIESTFLLRRVTELKWIITYEEELPPDPEYVLLDKFGDADFPTLLPPEIIEPTVHPDVIKVKLENFSQYITGKWHPIRLKVINETLFRKTCPLCQKSTKKRFSSVQSAFEKIRSLFQ